MDRPLPDPRCVVLYVDDEHPNTLVFAVTFEDEFDIVVAHSGEEALKIVATRRIDVVVTDQRMPGMTGIELCERLRAGHPDILRVLITAFPDHRSATDGTYRGGITRYLHKPWREEDVRSVLRELAARVRRNQEAASPATSTGAHPASPAADAAPPLYTLPARVREAVKLGGELAAQQLSRAGRIDLSGDTDAEVSADLTDVACILAKLFATAAMTLYHADRPDGLIRVVVADHADTVDIRIVEEVPPVPGTPGVALSSTRRLAADIGGELVVGDVTSGLGFLLRLPAHAPHRANVRAAG